MKFRLSTCLSLVLGLATGSMVSCSSTPPTPISEVAPEDALPTASSLSLPNDSSRAASIPDVISRRPPQKPAVSARSSLKSQSAAPTLYAPHDGHSQFSFEQFGTPGDTFVVNDQDSGVLNQYLERSLGPITADINVYKNVGDLPILLSKGLIGTTAELILPAFDVDAFTDPVFDCDGDGINDQLRREVDDVYWNGKKIGSLTGNDGVWKINRFSIPIQDIRFPTSQGAVATNKLEIRIDQANKDVVLSSGQVGCEVWLVDIDWAALKFQATSPVVLIPGFGGLDAQGIDLGSYATFIRGKTGLPAKNVSTLQGSLPPPFSACYDAFPAAQRNADVLRGVLKQEAKGYGTSGLHLIGYSKGGLDAILLINSLAQKPEYVEVGRMSGQPVLKELKIKSMASHDSPYGGTVIADAAEVGVIGLFAGYDYNGTNPLQAFQADLINKAISNLATQTNVCLLGTTIAPQLMAGGPRGVPTLAIAADADANGDRQLTTFENFSVGGSIDIANNFYQLLGKVSEISINSAGEILFPRNQNFEPNDTIVTVRSAKALPGVAGIRTFSGATDFADHFLVVRGEKYRQTVIDVGIGGVLQWRLR